jgi:oxygen-independent coproporphyrinogen-3 oxidase
VHVARAIPEERYVDALVREIDAAEDDRAWRGQRVDTVFFGGGTPSLFSPASFERVVRTLDRRFGVEPNAEVTIEANPEDVAPAALDDLRALRAAGVNRLSLGAQSFDTRVLEALGRMHVGADVERACAQARAAGFANVSCDLIFAVPGQSLDGWRADLERMIALAPEHLSTYGLTYEEGTPLTALRNGGRVCAIDESDERAMYETAIDVLTTAGYRHYEISNFARPGFESRHNLAYWAWSDYLGIGAGAHGFARGADASAATGQVWASRYANVKAPAAYMERSPAARATSETLDRATAMAEFILVGLRRIDGFAERAFAQTFGAELGAVSPALEGLGSAGVLARRDGRVALTREGLMLADSVTAKLADVSSE